MSNPSTAAAAPKSSDAFPPSQIEPIAVQNHPYNAETPMALLADAVTPTRSFYVRNHYEMAELDAGTHRLSVGGMVNSAFEYSLALLKQLPVSRQTITMECAGNGRSSLIPAPAGVPWRFGAVATAEFAGVALRSVLEKAGVKHGAVEVVLTGADRGSGGEEPVAPYSRSLTVEHAMNGDVLLAWEMNGEPLTVAHGFPLRVIVPRWYAMSSIKWLTRIEVVDRPFTGHWQTAQYLYVQEKGTPDRTPVSRLRVRSVIARPAGGERVRRGQVEIAGTAWSGEGGIVRVEVSTDGGTTWRDARLEKSAGKWSATPWRLEWSADRPGEFVLLSRATDDAGNTQPLEPRQNVLGYGNNGVQRVVVIVAE